MTKIGTLILCATAALAVATVATPLPHIKTPPAAARQCCDFPPPPPDCPPVCSDSK
ncbi:MAG TPA: hypothetical protein VKU19_19105 [Bryobacteraceae bacterium]|nr:hypothetical protein [Bryobacteraceae bacterium]